MSNSRDLSVNIEYYAEVITRLTEQALDADPDNEVAARRARADIAHYEKELSAMLESRKNGSPAPVLTPAPSMRNKPAAPARGWSKYSRTRRH